MFRYIQLINDLINETKHGKIEWGPLEVEIRYKLQKEIVGDIINGYSAWYRNKRIGIFLHEFSVFDREYDLYVKNKRAEVFISNKNDIYVIDEAVVGEADIWADCFRLYKLAQLNYGEIDSIVDDLIK